MKPVEQRYLSVPQAASYLGVSISTVRRYIQRSLVTVKRLPSGGPRIAREDLDRLFDAEPSRLRAGDENA
jgi:excisionase family DNA binding protein